MCGVCWGRGVRADQDGGERWQGQPAFDLANVPGMIAGLLDRSKEGWTWAELVLSFSVRQHDMVLLDEAGRLLLPALSWQCNAASQEVLRLRQQGTEAVVGRIEERFILPKLMWALAQAPSLAGQVQHVMTTGDWIAQLLTGRRRLSTSDALSNGLLQQKNTNSQRPRDEACRPRFALVPAGAAEWLGGGTCDGICHGRRR